MHNQSLSQLGPYQLLAEIGCGGMGKVYKAYHPQLEQEVAIKIIHNKNSITAKEKKRFLIEARTLAKLRHPNIVKIYDVGHENDHHFIVMDLIQGRPLSGIKCQSLSPRQNLALLKKIVLATGYAHSQGVIHRDLKPENIMIKQDETPIIMDFGLAKDIKAKDNLTARGEIMGTPFYMAPEQIKGKKISAQTDIYALGVILYQMLTGTTPFKGEDVTNLFYQVVHNEPQPLRQKKPQLAFDLEIICHKALEKDPDKRYQSAAKMVDDIDKFLNGEAIATSSLFFLHNGHKWIKRNKSMTKSILICFTLAILIFLAIRFYQYQKLQKKANIYIKKAQKIPSLPKAQKVNNRHLEKAIEASNYLAKALYILPQKDLKQRWYLLQRDIGLAAMVQKNYLLSWLVFNKIKRFGFAKEASDLLQTLEITKKKIKEKHLKRINNIMLALRTDHPPKDLIKWYMTELLRMRGEHVVVKLLPYIKSGYWGQQLIAIRALGKMQDTSTKVKNKDVVEWLLERLQNSKAIKETEELVWALGWLRDARANTLVMSVRRRHFGTPFWTRTKVPYRWIPMAKEQSGEGISTTELNRRALAKQEQGDFQGAIADYTKAIVLEPHNAAFYMNRSSARKKAKDIKGAIADLNHAIKLNPKLAAAYYNFGRLLFELKKYKQALKCFSKAIAINPKFAQAYSERGSLWGTVGQMKRSIKDMEKAIELNPKLFRAYSNLGVSYASIGKWREAIAMHTKSISINPRNTSAYINRAVVYRKQKQYQKALNDISQAIRIRPNYTPSYFQRAFLFKKRGMLKRALTDYSRVITLDPQNHDAYHNRGTTKAMLKDFRGAIADLNQATRLAPKDPNVYRSLGLAYSQMGQVKRAIVHFRKFLQMDPNGLQAKQIRKYIQNHTR